MRWNKIPDDVLWKEEIGKSGYTTGSKRNPRLLEISLEIPLGVLADQPTRADWLDL